MALGALGGWIGTRFLATPESWISQAWKQALVEAGYMDCYRALRAPPGYTYPSVSPWLRLDYMFAPSRLALRLAVCDVIEGGEARRASDHLPFWAEFA